MNEYEVSTRFHARPGNEDPLRDAVLGILAPVRAELQCLSVHAFRSVDDPRLFFITSRWVEKAAHVRHRTLAHTIEFLARAEALVDAPIESTYAQLIG